MEPGGESGPLIEKQHGAAFLKKRSPMAKIQKCIRCTGPMLDDGDGPVCLWCGERPSDADPGHAPSPAWMKIQDVTRDMPNHLAATTGVYLYEGRGATS